ncbi:MAG: trypsin-like serine protease [Desulfobulbaceae bacterium]|nr:trypsin-like serine protease [Desulfobulbaceae bacterium]
MKFSLVHFFAILLVTIIITPIMADDKKDELPDLQIVGGVNADIEDYPWQIAIFSVGADGKVEEQMCGGSIIDPYWILTAAHCVDTDAHKTQKIVAHITRRSQPNQGQVIEISDYIVHENFDINVIQNDVALLRLAYPIDTSKIGSKSIRLLTPEEEQNGLIAPGIMATTTGWGTTTYRGNAPDWLQVTSLPIITLETANQWFTETNGADEVNEVTADMLPTGYEEGGKSSCHGDSGGPLFVKDNTDTWVLAGITSWGAVCGGAKQPAVYTRVPYFYDWIISHSKLGIDDVPTEDDYIENIKIIIPENVYSCEGYSNLGEVLIRNMGLNDLTSFELVVKIGNSPDDIIKTDSQVITLEKSLPPLGSKRIQLPNILPDDVGKFYIEIEVSKPNDNNIAIQNASKGQYFNYSGNSPIQFTVDLEQVSNLKIQMLALSNYDSKTIANYGSADVGKKYLIENCLQEGSYYFYKEGSAKGSLEMTINHEGIDYLIGEADLQDVPPLYLTLPFVPSYDIYISIPNAISNDTIFVCDIFQFDAIEYFQLFNRGTLPIQNVILRTSFNGVVSDSSIDGKVFSRNIKHVPLDISKFKVGENTLKVEIIDYDNIENDLTPENNIAETKFYIIENPQIATIEWYGDNNSWSKRFEILNSEGKTVIVQNELPSTNYIYNACIPDGCYSFRPTDYIGEGVSKETAIVMKRMDGSVIFSISGKDFVSGKRFDFCTSVSSVEEISQDNLFIFPNPANDYIEISSYFINNSSSNNRSLGGVNLYNSLGEIVMTLPLAGSARGNVKIDISNLSTGLYFIRIGDKFEKFVKY